jgi:imidazoleglycerol phosphate dehydratase HisB
MNVREGSVRRTTAETDVQVRIVLDGEGIVDARTGLAFLDHMLAALGKHARFDLTVVATGDTHVDDHHTVEDTALALGAALDAALGDRAGIARFGHAYAPLDEALARAVVDLSGRPGPYVSLGLHMHRLGDVACENLTHFLRSLAIAARTTLHVDVLTGENDHHRAEAAFKAAALALRAAVAHSGPASAIPSTKGTL